MTNYKITIRVWRHTHTFRVEMCGWTACSIDKDNCISKGRSIHLSQTVHTSYSNIKYKPTTTEIDNIIKSLKAKVHMDYDETFTKILKISSSFIISPLNYKCNKALSKSIFSYILKFSVIKSLYKNKPDISNYKPKSLSTSFSKIFEKVKQTRLVDHLTK